MGSRGPLVQKTSRESKELAAPGFHTPAAALHKADVQICIGEQDDRFLRYRAASIMEQANVSDAPPRTGRFVGK